MTHSWGCTQGAYQLCLGCGARVCACHGMARGTCPLCFVGLLTNYVKSDAHCSFAGCKGWGIADGRRGKRYVCFAHAEKQGIKFLPREGDGKGQPTYRTTHIADERGLTL